MTLIAFIESLQDKGLIESGDFDRLKRFLDSSEEEWDQILTRLGIISEDQLITELSDYLDLRPLSSNELSSLSTHTNILNSEFCIAHRIALTESADMVAIVNPFDPELLRSLNFALGEYDVRLISHSQFERLCSPSLDLRVSGNDAPLDDLDLQSLQDLASTEPVVQLVNQLILAAHDRRSSDVHLEPGESGFLVSNRIDGMLHEHASLGRTEGLAVVSRLKIMAVLDIAERRRPQDGRFSFPVRGRKIDLRVSTVPTDFGESVVLRILAKDQVKLDYSALGYSRDQTEQIRALIHRSHGLVLLTGPTGSGKTTSLYTFLSELADRTRKILTIEDPIEYRLPHILQSQVNPQISVTFASALRSFLRHDPDVMMVGEIRDLETATIAIQAALTGHLVLSTLHTNDAASAITRLRDLGIANYLIASTLNGVISQRLVPRICGACSGRGCRECDGSGYKGRIAIAEVLEITQARGDAIRSNAPEDQIKSLDTRFISMMEDARRKCETGLIANAQIERALGVMGVSR